MFPERNIKPCLYQFLLRPSGRRWFFHAVVGVGSMTTSSVLRPAIQSAIRSSDRPVDWGGRFPVRSEAKHNFTRQYSFSKLTAFCQFCARALFNRFQRRTRPYPYVVFNLPLQRFAELKRALPFDSWSNFGAGQGWLISRKRNRSNDLD